jgi:hypothetical protein
LFHSLCLINCETHAEPENHDFTSISLDEGAETGDGFADDQVLHLEGPFVGIKRFRIREEATDVIVGGDAVASAQLPRPSDCLATLGGSECASLRRFVIAPANSWASLLPASSGGQHS